MSDEIMETEGQEPTQESTTMDERQFTQTEVERIVEQRLARERKKLEKKLDGVDLEEAKRLLEEKEKAEIERQKERGEFEEILKKTVAKKDEQLTALQKQLQREKVDGALLGAASKFNAVNAEQVSALLRSNVRLSETGEVEIVDNDGTIKYSDKGEPMTVQELTKEFLTANPHFVKATSGGTGSQGSAGGSTQKPSSVADMLANWNNGGKQAYAELKGKR